MVKVKRLEDTTIIELSPNRSLSWRQTRLVMLIFGGFCLSIAIIWSLVGAWLILPFAGVEVGLLWLLMYIVSKSTYQKQILLVNEKYLSMQYPSKEGVDEKLFLRNFLSLIGYETNHPEDVKEVFLVDKRQKHQIGSFLSQEDQADMLSALEKLDIHYKEIKKPLQIEI